MSRMVPDSYLAQYDALNLLPPRYQRKKNCHKLNADSVLGRSTKAYDVNGIAILLCRCVNALCGWIHLVC